MDSKTLGAIVDIAHYGAGLLLVGVGLLSLAGVQLPGVSVNPAVAITGGLGILGAGLKSGLTATKEH